MVIAWLKRVLEILNKTIAAAEAITGKRFLPTERLGYYRNELFAIRKDILELIARLREQWAVNVPEIRVYAVPKSNRLKAELQTRRGLAFDSL